MFFPLILISVCASLTGVVRGVATAPLREPFLISINNSTHIIGNGIWNVTVVRGVGRKLFYKNTELVGDSPGHYVSFSAWQNHLMRAHKPTVMPRLTKENK
jgi:hypothetical protein